MMYSRIWARPVISACIVMAASSAASSSEQRGSASEKAEIIARVRAVSEIDAKVVFLETRRSSLIYSICGFVRSALRSPSGEAMSAEDRSAVISATLGLLESDDLGDAVAATCVPEYLGTDAVDALPGLLALLTRLERREARLLRDDGFLSGSSEVPAVRGIIHGIRADAVPPCPDDIPSAHCAFKQSDEADN